MRAVATVPNGVFLESEIEEEDGRLIYCFEFSVAGQKGTTEIEIDAVTGEVIGTEHEDEDEDEDDRDNDVY